MKKILSLLSVALVSLSAVAASTPTTRAFSFSKNGKVIKTLTVAEMKKLIGESRFKTIEPHAKVELTYLGVDFDKLLESVYGKDWATAKKIKFTCLDGYNPLIDHKLFTKYDAYLVYAKDGESDFNLKKSDGKTIDMSPFYLTWDTFSSPTMNTVNNRPYQLTAIDLLF